MVGELSKYQQVKVTPSANTDLTFSHNLGVIPKLIIVDSNQTYVSTQYMKSGVFDQHQGAMSFLDVNPSATGYYYTVNLNSTGTTNANIYVSDSSVSIRRGAATRYFDTNTEYTVDIYA